MGSVARHRRRSRGELLAVTRGKCGERFWGSPRGCRGAAELLGVGVQAQRHRLSLAGSGEGCRRDKRLIAHGAWSSSAPGACCGCFPPLLVQAPDTSRAEGAEGEVWPRLGAESIVRAKREKNGKSEGELCVVSPHLKPAPVLGGSVLLFCPGRGTVLLDHAESPRGQGKPPAALPGR